MSYVSTLVAAAAVLAVATAGVAIAQQPSHQHGAGQQPPAATKPPMSGHDHDAHHAQHMEMCRQMMGQTGMGGGMGPGMMGGGMMGMPMMGGGDPKQHAEMLAMRGEMMKAMGDIMLRYAQRAQPAK